MPTADRMPGFSDMFITSDLANSRHPIGAGFLFPLFKVGSLELYRNSCRHVCLWLVLKCTQCPTRQEERGNQSLTTRAQGQIANKKFVFNLFPPNLNSGGQCCGQIWRHWAPPSGGPIFLPLLSYLWKGGMDPHREAAGTQWLSFGSFLLAPLCFLLGLDTVSPHLGSEERCW